MNIQPAFQGLQAPGGTFQALSTPPTRSEKTSQFVQEVLPASIVLGAQAFDGVVAAGAASASAAAASSAAAAATTATAAGTIVSGATIAGGVLGLANLALSWGKSTPAAGAASGAAAGAAIGTIVAPGIGTAIGAALGSIAGGLIGCIKTGKPRDQIVRDRVRAALVEHGVIDRDYTITLANGSKYDIGIDGKPRAEFGGRRPYDVDFNNPMTKYAVSWLNPLVALMSGGNQKVQTDFVGYFANAALSNAKSLSDVSDNVNAIMKQFGVSDEALYKTIVQAVNSGQLDSATAAAWINGMNERRSPSKLEASLSAPTAAPQ